MLNPAKPESLLPLGVPAVDIIYPCKKRSVFSPSYLEIKPKTITVVWKLCETLTEGMQ